MNSFPKKNNEKKAKTALIRSSFTALSTGALHWSFNQLVYNNIEGLRVEEYAKNILYFPAGVYTLDLQVNVKTAGRLTSGVTLEDDRSDWAAVALTSYFFNSIGSTLGGGNGTAAASTVQDNLAFFNAELTFADFITPLRLTAGVSAGTNGNGTFTGTGFNTSTTEAVFNLFVTKLD